MSEIDDSFRGVQAGDPVAFADWVRQVEIPLRAGLRRFAQVIDAESILQEGLLRMWVLAPRLRLSGPDASLRYAARLVRNLAISWVRRAKLLTARGLAELAALPEARVEPDPPPDPTLVRVLRLCLEKLPPRPREAILARLQDDGTSTDSRLSAGLRMTLNAFHQNVARARRLLAECLRRGGVNVKEYLA